MKFSHTLFYFQGKKIAVIYNIVLVMQLNMGGWLTHLKHATILHV